LINLRCKGKTKNVNEELKNKLQAAIVACADKAAKADTTALDALQWTQAAVNASNALIGLSGEARQQAI